jgi:hypothetical protein
MLKPGECFNMYGHFAYLMFNLSFISFTFDPSTNLLHLYILRLTEPFGFQIIDPKLGCAI